MGDERVEAFRNGEAANEGLGVGDEVKDLEDQRVREPIEAVHFEYLTNLRARNVDVEMISQREESCFFLRRRSESVGVGWGPRLTAR